MKKMVYSQFSFCLLIPILVYTIFFSTSFSLGSDTLLPKQTLPLNQTLISQNQNFELGFFFPGHSKNRFLGIWYKLTPEIVVWVANRRNPIVETQEEIALGIGRNGTLEITVGGSILWSFNSSGLEILNPLSLQLLDTGNLVILDSKTERRWQSFDYPGDTWLPGMGVTNNPNTGELKYLTSWRSPDDPSPGDFTYKIENRGLSQLVLFKGTAKSCRGRIFDRDDSLWITHPNYVPELIFNESTLISITLPYNATVVTRIKMDYSGSVQRYNMNEARDRWSLLYTVPRDPCDNYAHCGPYGVCSINKETLCECLPGFAPKSRQDWDNLDFSGGCSRITAPNCLDENSDGFLEMGKVKFPDTLSFLVNNSLDIVECEAWCLRNCSCTAYSHAYGNQGCLFWFGDFIDIREISGVESTQAKIYIRVPVSVLVSSRNMLKKNWPVKLILMISIFAVGVLLVGLIYGSILLVRRQKRQEIGKKIINDLDLPLFSLASVVAATDNFSCHKMIGEGGFGPVYRGNLLQGEIALKRMSNFCGQGLEQFKTEVALIAKLQHINLVRLLGCCIEREERMLIYEYMPNQSLDYFLFDQNKKRLLDWPKRFKIIMGIAKGLLYLHHDSRVKIIHRDLKTSNILLDENLNPKISDFGLARTFEGDQSVTRTKRVIGTYGYMAPEYAIHGKFSTKSDIFSMGIILLEIVSGKKNTSFNHLDHYHGIPGYAWLLWKENKAEELLDECLMDSFVDSQVKICIQVGLLCVQKLVEDRPIMASVVSMLGNEGVILPDPKEPGFFIGGSSRNARVASVESGNNTMTITDLEAR